LLAELQPAWGEENRKSCIVGRSEELDSWNRGWWKKIAELPESTEKIRKEASVALTESKQLKTKLSALSNTQEVDQKLLENISKMISDASNVISKYLSI
jgi:hypothetical protein